MGEIKFEDLSSRNIIYMDEWLRKHNRSVPLADSEGKFLEWKVVEPKVLTMSDIYTRLLNSPTTISQHWFNDPIIPD